MLSKQSSAEFDKRSRVDPYLKVAMMMVVVVVVVVAASRYRMQKRLRAQRKQRR